MSQSRRQYEVVEASVGGSGRGAVHRWLVSFWAATGGYFNLKARHSGKCLDVVNANTADGADIQHYTCNGGTNQQWSRTPVLTR